MYDQYTMNPIPKKRIAPKRRSRNTSFETKEGIARRATARINPSNVVMSAQNLKLNNKELAQDLEFYNPTLKSILKVEELFLENGEFDSRTQLIRALGGSMKIQVLDVILKYLQSQGKVIDNDDGSWTWIFSKYNKKMRASWDKAVPL